MDLKANLQAQRPQHTPHKAQNQSPGLLEGTAGKREPLRGDDHRRNHLQETLGPKTETATARQSLFLEKRNRSPTQVWRLASAAPASAFTRPFVCFPSNLNLLSEHLAKKASEERKTHTVVSGTFFGKYFQTPTSIFSLKVRGPSFSVDLTIPHTSYLLHHHRGQDPQTPS